ncbi:MAG: hypothetical protein Q8L74_16520 [Nitrospirota bacterium]|nr:hypothetical protein [Nitrospirota bacterium]
MDVISLPEAALPQVTDQMANQWFLEPFSAHWNLFLLISIADSQAKYNGNWFKNRSSSTSFRMLVDSVANEITRAPTPECVEILCERMISNRVSAVQWSV